MFYFSCSFIACYYRSYRSLMHTLRHYQKHVRAVPGNIQTKRYSWGYRKTFDRKDLQFLVPYPTNSVDRDSSDGIATGYWLGGPGIESRMGRHFPHLSRPTLGPIQPSVQWVQGFSRGKERPGRDADPSFLSSTVVKKGYGCTSTPPMGRTACTEPQCLHKAALYLTLPHRQLSCNVLQVTRPLTTTIRSVRMPARLAQ